MLDLLLMKRQRPDDRDGDYDFSMTLVPSRTDLKELDDVDKAFAKPIKKLDTLDGELKRLGRQMQNRVSELKNTSRSGKGVENEISLYGHIGTTINSRIAIAKELKAIAKDSIDLRLKLRKAQEEFGGIGKYGNLGGGNPDVARKTIGAAHFASQVVGSNMNMINPNNLKTKMECTITSPAIVESHQNVQQNKEEVTSTPKPKEEPEPVKEEITHVDSEQQEIIEPNVIYNGEGPAIVGKNPVSLNTPIGGLDYSYALANLSNGAIKTKDGKVVKAEDVVFKDSEKDVYWFGTIDDEGNMIPGRERKLSVLLDTATTWDAKGTRVDDPYGDSYKVVEKSAEHMPETYKEQWRTIGDKEV